MQQYWNQNLQLADELVKQCETLKPTDIMV